MSRGAKAALAQADERLLQIADAALREGAGRAGDRLACRPGCTECCLGPFPINRLDAWRLRRGLDLLSRREPEKARGIRARARDAIARLAGDFPGEGARGLLCGDDAVEDAFFERHSALACPALDPAEGTCALYEFRPMNCRTFGPPVRVGGEALPPCRLCFVGAAPEEIESCRVEPDRAGMEDAILDGMTALDGDERETIVAFALAARPAGSARSRKETRHRSR